MKKIVYCLILLLSILLISCGSTEYITKEVPIEVIKEVPIETVRTEYINNYIIDSTFVKDSIDRYFKGDTLVIYKEKQLIKYKLKGDTVVVRDTVPVVTEINVPVPVKEEIIKEVEVNKLYWYQDILIYIGILTLVFFGIKLLTKYLRK